VQVAVIVSPGGIRRGRFRADELATPRSGASRPPRGPGEPAPTKAPSLAEPVSEHRTPMNNNRDHLYLSLNEPGTDISASVTCPKSNKVSTMSLD